MDIIGKVEEITGKKFEDLNYETRSVVKGWIDNLSQKEPTLEGLKNLISSWKSVIENELSKNEPSFFSWFFGWKNDFALKARLRNLILIEGFLQGPSKSKKALEDYLNNLDRKRG